MRRRRGGGAERREEGNDASLMETLCYWEKLRERRWEKKRDQLWNGEKRDRGGSFFFLFFLEKDERERFVYKAKLTSFLQIVPWSFTFCRRCPLGMNISLFFPFLCLENWNFEFCYNLQPPMQILFWTTIFSGLTISSDVQYLWEIAFRPKLFLKLYQRVNGP